MNQTSPHMTIMMRAAEKAGRSLVRDFGEVEQLQVSVKGPGDFVSAADKRSEEIIYEELNKSRPGYAFLMEESGAIDGEKNEYRWIIDPLDGTTNFLHGIPHWCISIALEHKDEIIAGLVYDPAKDELFHAEKNGGAFMRRKRLRVSGRNNPQHSVATAGGMGRTKKTKEQFIKEYSALRDMGFIVRRYGAAALDLTYVAAGRYDAFWERRLNPWDVAAGMLIVKEAGGFVCELDDDKRNPVETGNLIASNVPLHADMKKILRSV